MKINLCVNFTYMKIVTAKHIITLLFIAISLNTIAQDSTKNSSIKITAANNDTVGRSAAFKETYRLMRLNFVSGTMYFSGDGFTNVVTVDLKTASPRNCFSRCIPGSIITIEHAIYKNPDGTLSKPITEIIKEE
jgi:hypothetical protein